MSEILHIEQDGTLYAIVVPPEARTGGVQFVTGDDGFLQVGFQERAGGTTVEAHVHRPRNDVVDRTEELLYVESGRIDVTIFDGAWKELWRGEIGAGGAVLFVRGGHAIEWLEESRLLEVKQGPYRGKAEDKRGKMAGD